MSKTIFLLLVILILHLFLLFNLRFTAWPEMVSYAYLRNHGFLLYRDMIHPYPPLFTMALSYLYGIFGYRLEILKAFTWTIILVNDFLIFVIVNKLTKSDKLSALSLTFYAIIQPFLEGNQLWFDLTIVPPILLATYYLLQKSTPRNLLIAGFAMGIATFIKQTAGLFIVFSILYLVFRKIKIKDLIYFLIGPFVLGIPLLIRLLQEGALEGFINWTFKYPLLYWGKFPGYVQMSITHNQAFLIFLLLLPMIITLIFLRNKIFLDKNLLLIYLLFITSFILVYPRFSFFHLQLAIALSSIAYGYVITKIKLSPILHTTYFMLLIYFIVLPTIRSDWNKETRFWSKDDLKLANLISQNVEKGQRVYLLGPHSLQYALSDRIPPRPWSDNFGWYLEIPGVQNEIIRRWEGNPPNKIVWQEPSAGNWFDLGTYQPKLITKWITQNYTKKSEIEKGIWLWQRKD